MPSALKPSSSTSSPGSSEAGGAAGATSSRTGSSTGSTLSGSSTASKGAAVVGTTPPSSPGTWESPVSPDPRNQKSEAPKTKRIGMRILFFMHCELRRDRQYPTRSVAVTNLARDSWRRTRPAACF